MQRKKSRFWLFICSLIPGAGEMYLGFMKMGVSLMLGFVVLSIAAGILDLSMIYFIPMVMYAYCFFHANNLGTLGDEEFYAVRDQYLFGLDGLSDIEKMQDRLSQRYRKIAAAVLIIIGVVMLWDQIFSWLLEIVGHDNYYLSRIRYFMRHDFLRIVFAVVVIWIGCRLIRGKKAEYIEEDTAERETVNVQTVSGNPDITSGQSTTGAPETLSEQQAADESDNEERQGIPDAWDNGNEQ